jgi:flagellar hook-associated protein 3 FlgL
MLSILNSSAQQFLNSVNRINDNNQKAQRELSTGLKISSVSDSPDQISTLLVARANLAAVKQTDANLSQTKAETDTAEGALENAVTLYDRVQTLAAEGVNSTQTAASRAATAQELGSILQQLGGLADTQVEGRYIFAGDSDQTAPYKVDLTQANPVSAYLGTSSTRVAQNPNGTTFPTSLTAQQIFDSPTAGNNAFQSIVALRTALLNNDQTGIQNAQSGLTQVASFLNTQLAFYGTVQNKVADATNFGANLETQLQTQISTIQDADSTQAILDLQQGSTQLQAALQARAKLPQQTLFDFLA